VGRRSVLPLGGAGRVNDKKVNEEDGKRSFAAEGERCCIEDPLKWMQVVLLDTS
jgi:hypothetical protein